MMDLKTKRKSPHPVGSTDVLPIAVANTSAGSLSSARIHSLAVSQTTIADPGTSRSTSKHPSIAASATLLTGSSTLISARRASFQGSQGLLKHNISSQNSLHLSAMAVSVTSSHETLSKSNTASHQSLHATLPRSGTKNANVSGLMEGMEAKLKLAETNFEGAKKSQDSLNKIVASGAAPYTQAVPQVFLVPGSHSDLTDENTMDDPNRSSRNTDSSPLKNSMQLHDEPSEMIVILQILPPIARKSDQMGLAEDVAKSSPLLSAKSQPLRSMATISTKELTARLTDERYV